jgi:hypothetical protein
LRAKHVNTCSYDFEAATRVEILVLQCSHIDRGHLYEPIGIRIIVLCALDVEIINVHVFTCQPSLVYYILHIRLPMFLSYKL